MAHSVVQLLAYAAVIAAGWLAIGQLVDLADPVAPGSQQHLPPAGKTALITIVDEDGVTLDCYTTPDRVSSDIIYIPSHAYLEVTLESLGCESPPAT
jgi:hypothetical protein